MGWEDGQRFVRDFLGGPLPMWVPSLPIAGPMYMSLSSSHLVLSMGLQLGKIWLLFVSWSRCLEGDKWNREKECKGLHWGSNFLPLTGGPGMWKSFPTVPKPPGGSLRRAPQVTGGMGQRGMNAMVGVGGDHPGFQRPHQISHESPLNTARPRHKLWQKPSPAKQKLSCSILLPLFPSFYPLPPGRV